MVLKDQGPVGIPTTCCKTGGSADPLPFQADIYFDTIGDLHEWNVLVNAIVFAIAGHCTVDAPEG